MLITQANTESREFPAPSEQCTNEETGKGLLRFISLFPFGCPVQEFGCSGRSLGNSGVCTDVAKVVIIRSPAYRNCGEI